MALSIDELELESAEYIPAREVMTAGAAVSTVGSTVDGLLGTVDVDGTVGEAAGLVNGSAGEATGLVDGTLGTNVGGTVGDATGVVYGTLGTAGGIL